ncbi:MAG: acyltransferase [Saprospiraceae bacterium]|nr:acyltransferase [Saprospiraceae bacterium]
MAKPFIHQTAIIDPEVRIGEDTSIWHFVHVMSGASIGQQCTLGQNVFVGEGVRIGDGVKIQNNVSVYRGVELEDHVFVGPSAVFTNVLNPRSEINRRAEIRPTRVRQGATIGANATIICGIEIGAYAFIGAGAVVTKPVPSYALVTGNPAHHAGWMSVQGYKLEFNREGQAICPGDGSAYVLKDGTVTRKP